MLDDGIADRFKARFFPGQEKLSQNDISDIVDSLNKLVGDGVPAKSAASEAKEVVSASRLCVHFCVRCVLTRIIVWCQWPIGGRAITGNPKYSTETGHRLQRQRSGAQRAMIQALTAVL